MNIEVNDVVKEQFSRSLKALRGILVKAKSYANDRKFDENNFLHLRLAPDMFPFVKQIQIATDNAKGAAARLSGKTAPVFADDEKTLEELINRVDRTISFLADFKADDFKEFSEKKISFPWYPGKYLMGEDYLISHAVPNFYFHMMAAYSILRLHGLPLGKGDYMGEQNWHAE